jgi:chromosome segregation ATPase
MPFAAAEALHWGRETWNQHNQLFGRMGELEERYGVHDRRIQVTEAIAEAAEAATARIRRIEQQVAAIESDEHDRPFDKWAQEEIASFKGFIEKNKSVRQKQVELDKQVSNLEDSFDKVKDAPRDLDILLHRIGRLEQDRMHDADRIQRLETDMTALISSWQTKATEINRPRPDSPRKQTPRHMMPAPPRPQAEALEIEEDTEDEETLIPPPVEQPVQAQIQVRQSPKISSE